MKIDITAAPPSNIFQDRGKYLWICLTIMALAASGILLMIYGALSDMPSSDTLETVSLALLVGPAILFVYFGGKLRAYKRLGPREQKELLGLRLKYPAIATYCDLVGKEDRRLIWAEYEACREWAEDAQHEQQ